MAHLSKRDSSLLKLQPARDCLEYHLSYMVMLISLFEDVEISHGNILLSEIFNY